jgi:hypothetical protein
MLKQLTGYFSNTKKFSNLFKKHLDNKEAITNILSEIIITLGVVLIVGGIYLMILDPSSSNQTLQTTVAAKTVINTTAWIPGIPFFVNDLANCSITAIGLVSWLMGINLLLTGLGLWVRHGLARLVALSIFCLSASVQFVQFLLFGIIGSPNSVVLLILDAVILYLLFTKVDSHKIKLKQVQMI